MTEDDIVEWHHRLNGHEFEQTPGDSEGQGSLLCCAPWGWRVRHDLATEQQQPFCIYVSHGSFIAFLVVGVSLSILGCKLLWGRLIHICNC